MAHHVGQGFLGDAEQRRGVGVGQLDRAAGGAQAHGQGRRPVRAGNGEFPSQVFQRRGQAQVVQQRGPARRPAGGRCGPAPAAVPATIAAAVPLRLPATA
ncbi:hypothetical protein G6F35_016616 [Rhizopus arrhizus]|nr:hypothetical protein G6F35_016616 [Rhizopus arrhizus]